MGGYIGGLQVQPPSYIYSLIVESPQPSIGWQNFGVVCSLTGTEVERTGAVVKPRTLGREVPGSSTLVAFCCARP